MMLSSTAECERASGRTTMCVAFAVVQLHKHANCEMELIPIKNKNLYQSMSGSEPWSAADQSPESSNQAAEREKEYLDQYCSEVVTTEMALEREIPRPVLHRFRCREMKDVNDEIFTNQRAKFQSFRTNQANCCQYFMYAPLQIREIHLSIAVMAGATDCSFDSLWLELRGAFCIYPRLQV
ncbi:hypothetical protein DV515_00004439 [Chloebia gouldiae]|uniref:Uncharacterized protein n=1 Tax=Chloebia gouldiae TaxID=44316 RepID=A0A3L8SR67_CHLGU|nr:hypothetical protein DV515_00004439 [Chloebia gouldiae]